MTTNALLLGRCKSANPSQGILRNLRDSQCERSSGIWDGENWRNCPGYSPRERSQMAFARRRALRAPAFAQRALRAQLGASAARVGQCSRSLIGPVGTLHQSVECSLGNLHVAFLVSLLIWPRFLSLSLTCPSRWSVTRTTSCCA